MSAAAPRTAQSSPEMRQLGVALGALTLAVALLVAVAFSQQAASQSSTLPAAGSAPVVHDHGWISTSYKATRPFIPRGGFDKAHAAGGSIKVSYPVIEGGGTLFTGIPYVPTRNDASGGSNGTRFAQ